MERTAKMYRTLFASTFLISAFTIGGGYVIVPLLQKKFVDGLKWIEEEQMMDFVAIAQSSPGPIAINTSILIGYRMGGFLGAFVAILAAILPPFLIVSLVSLFYEAFKENPFFAALLGGMRAGVAAVITDVIVKMGEPFFKKRAWLSVTVMALVFFAAWFKMLNLAIIVLTCGLAGMFGFLCKNEWIPPVMNAVVYGLAYAASLGFLGRALSGSKDLVGMVTLGVISIILAIVLQIRRRNRPPEAPETCDEAGKEGAE